MWKILSSYTQTYGHIFKYVGASCFLAYEYKSGSVTNLGSVSENFFSDLIGYLCMLGLQDVLGLQVLDESTDIMVKFDLTQLGTVMMKEQDAQHGEIFRITGWSFHYNIDGIMSYKGGESHAKTTKGTHQVFIDGKIGSFDSEFDKKFLLSVMK